MNHFSVRRRMMLLATVATSTVLVDPRRSTAIESNQAAMQMSNFGTDDATIESETLLIQSIAILQRVKKAGIAVHHRCGELHDLRQHFLQRIGRRHAAGHFVKEINFRIIAHGWIGRLSTHSTRLNCGPPAVQFLQRMQTISRLPVFTLC